MSANIALEMQTFENYHLFWSTVFSLKKVWALSHVLIKERNRRFREKGNDDCRLFSF